MLEIHLTVDGMMTETCESQINSALSNTFEIRKISSNHRSNKTLICTDAPIAKDMIAKTLDPLGYRILEYACIDQARPHVYFR